MKPSQLLPLLTMTVCLFNPPASAARAEPAAPPREAVCTEVSAAELPTAEPAAEPPAHLRVCVRAKATRGALYLEDGTLLQELTFDRNDRTVAGPLHPGTYRLKAGGLSVTFTLLENGSLCRVSGDGWTDAERLYVQSVAAGELTVLFDGPWRWTLEGETVPTPELTGGCCRYRALPLGSYRLRSSDRTIPLLLTPDTAEQTLDLRAAP